MDAAEGYYHQVLAANPEYARALLGAAETRFQRSKGTCEPGQVDEAGVRSAIDGYQAALRARDQPIQSNIELKAGLATARAYICLSNALVGDFWEIAKEQLNLVIEAYHGGNQRANALAAEAYGSLGLYHTPSVCDPDPGVKYAQALEAYERAADLSRRPGPKAIYFSRIGYIKIRQGRIEEAKADYARAIELAPSRRQELEAQRDSLLREVAAQQTVTPGAPGAC